MLPSIGDTWPVTHKKAVSFEDCVHVADTLHLLALTVEWHTHRTSTRVMLDLFYEA